MISYVISHVYILKYSCLLKDKIELPEDEFLCFLRYYAKVENLKGKEPGKLFLIWLESQNHHSGRNSCSGPDEKRDLFSGHLG
jgi:hypothetical protein